MIAPISIGATGIIGGRLPWDIIHRLKAGLAPPRRPPQVKMRKTDGSIASTAEESACVFAEHFTELYGRSPQFDHTVLDMMQQLPVVPDDAVPLDDEIHLSIGKLHATTPGVSGLNAKPCKALAVTGDGFALIRRGIRHFWETENLPDDWEVGLLSIMPKKGDLSKPGNYHGIMMLEVFCKIDGIIIIDRLIR